MHVSTYYDCFIEDICFIQFLKKVQTNKQKTSTCVVIDQHKVFVNNSVQNIIKLLIFVSGIVSSYPCTLTEMKSEFFICFTVQRLVQAQHKLNSLSVTLVEQTSLNNFHQSCNAPKIAKKIALNKNLQPRG